MLLVTLTKDPLAPPNRHAMFRASCRFKPCSVTVVPPATGPELGRILLMDITRWYTNFNGVTDQSAPFGETVTFMLPGRCTGDVHSSLVLVCTTEATCAETPNRHRRPALPSKPAPLTCTTVPPASGPALGSSRSIVIACKYENSAPPCEA